MSPETLDVEKVEQLLRAKGWTRAELAKRAGMTGGGLVHVLGGQGNPRLNTLANMACALGVRVSDLLKEAAPEEVGQAAS